MTSNAENTTEELLSKLLKEISVKENVIDPIYRMGAGSSKGDGYTSYITKVDISGKNKTLPVVIKNSAKLTESAKSMPVKIMFMQEIKYYREILPALKKFNDNKCAEKPFRAFPFCYKTYDSGEEQKIVLENITVKGFKMFKRKELMNDAHVELFMKTMGQFHGISFAMRDQEFEGFSKLRDGVINPFSTAYFGQDFFDVYLDGMEKIKQLFVGEPEVYKKMSILKDELMPFFRNAIKYDGKYGVFTHGDCWCNNMMFKYQDNNSNQPIALCLYDFQIGSLMTPVFDLAYFFYTSATAERLNNLDRYLKIYHDSLREHMLVLGSDVDKLYPFSALKEEWKKYSKFGIYLSSLIYRLLLRDDEELLDFMDNLTPVETFMKKSKFDHLINERYRLIALHFHKNDFI